MSVKKKYTSDIEFTLKQYSNKRSQECLRWAKGGNNKKYISSN